MKRIVFIGNYQPRQCGIATFTTDLSLAIASKDPEIDCLVIPINDIVKGYDYSPDVRFEIEEQNLDSYHSAADFLNFNNIDLVCLQHEYGIYGGPSGSHILALLRELRMPVVTTLHTVLRDPDPVQRKVLIEIARLSDRIVVMSNMAVKFLTTIYGIPAEKIDLIHHGIPDVAFVDPNFYKDQFGVEGKPLLSTFGLLSPNKGIESVIEALPKILEHHPDVVYFVLGATHPNVLRHDGENYRLKLQRIAREKGVSSHVIFHNRFVSLKELTEFIGATDIYITPYLNPVQIVSGTLAYTVGAGKAVISTPYWYAEDLLADGRGILVPFADPGAIAEQVNYLLDNEAERHAMRKKAFKFGREMIWPVTAQHYLNSFERARQERTAAPSHFVARQDNRPIELPPLNLDHLERMTDSTGLLQHALFDIPNYKEGYSTDDNARALILSVLMEETSREIPKAVYNLASRYLAFLNYAFNPDNLRFRNFLSFDRRWLEEIGSEDSHGRSLWGLGTVLGHSNNHGMSGLASRMFVAALPVTLDFTSPRAWAYTLLGVNEYLKRFAGDSVAHLVLTSLAERLLELYKHSSSPDWLWFEDSLTYCNAAIPHALLMSGYQLQRSDLIDAGIKSLKWLTDLQRTETGYFNFIGTNGFYRRDGEKAAFDQQPIEAQTMLSACLYAHRITGDKQWYRDARSAFEWFVGSNHVGQAIYDPSTGGCHDGLHPNSLNQNQGAESTLAFLLSRVEIQLHDYSIDLIEPIENLTAPAKKMASLVTRPGYLIQDLSSTT